MQIYILLVFIIASLLTSAAIAEIILPVLFRDGMVLQREEPLRIFGQASDGAPITVRLNGQKMTTAAQNGKGRSLSRPCRPAVLMN
jgi:sialate O-acetylesterase